MCIHLFVMGKKGLKVAESALDPRYVQMIENVIIGKDCNVDNDFSVEIAELCQQADVTYQERTEFKKLKLSFESSTAIAVGWRWLIKEPYKNVVVFHDSLLPKYRGFNPLVSALLNRDKYVGATVILGNQEFDLGDILISEKIWVDYPTTIAEVIDRIADLYGDLAVKLLEKYSNGEELKGAPQNEDEASYSVWRDEDDFRIDWSQSAEQIEHFINCVGPPYHGASAMVHGEIVRIHSACAEQDVVIENRDVGKVMFIRDEQPFIICGEGLLRIEKIKTDDGYDVLPLPRFKTRFR